MPAALDHIMRTRCRPLRRTTPAPVIQTLQNIVMPARIQFADYLSELRLVVTNVKCVGRGHTGVEDGVLRLRTIKNGVDNQLAGLEAHIIAGRSMPPLPHGCVDDVMEVLFDMPQNRRQTTPTRWFGTDGGQPVGTCAKTLAKAFQGQ